MFIIFNLFDISYYLRNIETELGTFMRITKYDIVDNSLINIGESYLVLSFEKSILSAVDSFHILAIKVFNNNMQNKILTITIKLFASEEEMIANYQLRILFFLLYNAS